MKMTKKTLLLAAVAISAAYSQSTKVTVQATNIPGINSSWPGEGAGCAGTVDNRSQSSRRNWYHSVVASGTGSWTVTLRYSNVSCTGPWTAYPGTASITQVSSPAVAFALDTYSSPASFINISITGNAVVTYVGQNQLPLSTASGAATFPCTVAQGCTGLTSIPAHSLPVGNGTSTMNTIAPGPVGNVLTSNGGSADPSFQPNSQDYEFPSAYNFSAQTCNASNVCSVGGTSGAVLAPGANTLTLTPFPLGMNGSDSNHWVLITGGVGATEPCQITGGSGTAGATSGTVVITCGLVHAGAWQFESKDGGIQESITASLTSKKATYIQGGLYSIYAAIQVPTKTTILAAGQGLVTLQIANGALAANAAWQEPGQANYWCVICLAKGGYNQTVRDFTLDANGVNQTFIYYADIIGVNSNYALVDSVTVKNHPIAGGTGSMVDFSVEPPGSIALSVGTIIRNTTSIGIPNCMVPNGGGAYYIEGTGTRIESSYAYNYCDTPYVVDTCLGCSLIDNVADLGTGNHGTDVFGVTGSQGTIVMGNRCLATGINPNYICFNVNSSQNHDMVSTGNQFIGNYVKHANFGQTVNGINNLPADLNSDVVIDGLVVENSGNYVAGISLTAPINKVRISNATLTGNGGTGSTGMSVVSSGASVVTNVSLTNSTIDHWNYGILIQNTGSGVPISNFTMTGNFDGDTFATPLQTVALTLQGTGTVDNTLITGNTFLGNTSGVLAYTNTWGSNVIVDRNVGAATVISGSSNLVCVGTPGNTIGFHNQNCQTAAGALYVCNNSSNCTVSGDWLIVGGGGGGTPGGSSGQYQFNSSGAFAGQTAVNAAEAFQRVEGCVTGTVSYSALIANATSQEITIITGMSEKMRYRDVLVQEATMFTGTVATLTSSMGRPGVDTDLLPALPLMQATAPQNSVEDRAGAPILGSGTYNLVLNFVGATALGTGAASHFTAGAVNWEVCGLLVN